jgi:Cu/Ag efflux protein CusF
MKEILRIFLILILATFAVAMFACNSQQHDMANMNSAGMPMSNEPGTQIYQSVGKVTGINSTAKEVTIDHQDIPGLMSAMRMTFAVKDVAVLNDLSVGDDIDFELERNGSDLTVTKILRKGGTEVSGGARIFKANCARCHGENGEGTDKGISFLKGHALDHPKADFIDQVRNGEDRKMPSFKDKLDDEQIEQVVLYVRNVIQKDVKKDETPNHDH